MKENKRGVAVRSIVVVGRGGGGTECTATKVAKLCPLVLLVKGVRRQGKVLKSKEGRVMGNGQFEHGVEHLGWDLNSAEFCIWRDHYDKILIPLGGLRLCGESLLGGIHVKHAVQYGC
jgi:hypothetical protein